MAQFKVVAAHVKARDVKYRLVRNPNYNDRHVEFRNWCYIDFDPNHARKPGFFMALKKSVKKDGFRNPIVVYNFPQGLMLSFGGSRLRTGQELDMMIPAIVVDFCDQYKGQEVTQENYACFFTDVPKHFVIDSEGVDTHYSLERNRRHEYDPAGLKWSDAIPDKSFIQMEFPWLDQT